MEPVAAHDDAPVVGRARDRILVATRVAGAVVAVLAGLAIAGWLIGARRLTQPIDGAVGMKFTTAVCVLLLALVLVAGEREPSVASRVTGLVVALVAWATLLQYPLGRGIGIDELVVEDRWSASAWPGRMSVITAVCLVALGLAVLTDGWCVGGRRPAVAAAALAGTLDALVLLGHLYGVESLQRPVGAVSTTVVSALATTTIATALLLRRTTTAWLRLFTSAGPGGFIIRRVLPVVVGLLVLMAWVRVVATRAGLFGDEMGVALLTAASAVTVVAALVVAARRLEALDEQNREAERRALAAAERERDLEARLARSQRLEAIGQLAGGIAHDFNNLLTVILGTTELVRSAPDVGDEAGRDLDAVMAAAQRARDLTRQLLTFARRSIGPAQLVDARELLAHQTDLLRRTLGDEIHVEVVLPPDPVLVRIDPAQLEAAIVNLAVNARDAMTGGGTLTAALDVVDVDDATLGGEGSGPGTYACLRIADTGVGMSEAVLARAFEPFFTTKPEGLGSGLGLASVYGAVTGAGGVVRIASTVGVGTEVRLLLPAVTTEAPPAATTGDPPADDGVPRRRTVLVVEDEPPVLETARRMLADAGYTVLAAALPADAIALVRDGACVDVVVTDVMMPEMTGPEMVAELRSACPHTAIVYMSGYTAGVLEGRRLLDDGARIVEKPFTRRQLLHAVDAAARH